MNIVETLIKHEGWEVIQRPGQKRKVVVYGQEFPFTHPFAIHSKLYRETENPELRYLHFKAMHDYLWPKELWHYWTRDRFESHTDLHHIITWAGGASTAKSYDAAKIAVLFYLADPQNRGVIVASTSLESLEARVWGYIKNLLATMDVRQPIRYIKTKPPKIIFQKPKSDPNANIDDTVHGMFAVAAKKGDDYAAISTWIGRHPKKALLVILDEATDLPHSILKAIPNLEAGGNMFQLIAIGNSNSKNDLHGALSTPKDGWDTVDAKTSVKWQTNYKEGIAMFFSCYNSPAVHETDPIRKELLSRFLITQHEIDEKVEKYGADSDAFYRFVLGFWRSESTDDTMLSEKFIKEKHLKRVSEWSGLMPLNIVAGLDPAFSTGGDQCILQFAILGHDTDGNLVLDFRDDNLTFKIQIKVIMDKSAELQIADQVIAKLNQFRCPLRNLFIDANGQGRALGEVIKLRMNDMHSPMKVYSSRVGKADVKSFDIMVKPAFDLWDEMAQFIRSDQIRGMSRIAAMQLIKRLIIVKGNRKTMESKADYKTRMQAINPKMSHSPDEADACSLAVQSAMMMYGFRPGQKINIKKLQQRIHGYVGANDAALNNQKRVRAPIPVADFKGTLHDQMRLKKPF